jgi:hypothetical protein
MPRPAPRGRSAGPRSLPKTGPGRTVRARARDSRGRKPSAGPELPPGRRRGRRHTRAATGSSSRRGRADMPGWFRAWCGGRDPHTCARRSARARSSPGGPSRPVSAPPASGSLPPGWHGGKKKQWRRSRPGASLTTLLRADPRGWPTLFGAGGRARPRPGFAPQRAGRWRRGARAALARPGPRRGTLESRSPARACGRDGAARAHPEAPEPAPAGWRGAALRAPGAHPRERGSARPRPPRGRSRLRQARGPAREGGSSRRRRVRGEHSRGRACGTPRPRFCK